jgi:hypothetical protein
LRSGERRRLPSRLVSLDVYPSARGRSGGCSACYRPLPGHLSSFRRCATLSDARNRPIRFKGADWRGHVERDQYSAAVIGFRNLKIAARTAGADTAADQAQAQHDGFGDAVQQGADGDGRAAAGLLVLRGLLVAGAFAVSGAVAVEQRVGREVDGCAGDEPDRGGDGAAMADGLVDSGVY